MKVGVIVFPGSNCDRDMKVALEAAGAEVTMVWHQDTKLPKLDLVVLPGGFSYGDYLRCGAIAAHSHIIAEVVKHAKAGGKVLGVCNGFQVLAETGLVPGALMRNKSLKFICKPQALKVASNDNAFTSGFKKDQEITFPIAHGEGNYYADEKTLKEIEDNNQVALRYVGNPNGSANNIAGVFNKKGNVIGMMPHPERVISEILGGTDGKTFFQNLIG